MALGPIVKVVAQAAVMGVTILLRAIPAAYGAALQNARKSGVDAASQSAKNTTTTIFGSKRMELDEALLILNIEKKNLLSTTSSSSSTATTSTTSTTEQIQNQYNKYFQANSVEKGGSFYLQSKIYRAKEMLDEYVKEQQQLKEQQQKKEEQGK